MSGPIHALVFSKNRAAQLDLLLRSIEKYAAHIYDSITVLATAESGFVSAYLMLEAEHDIEIRAEQDFQADTLAWLNGGFPDDPISFLVDDDVFYRTVRPPLVLPCSLRGGDYWYPFSVDGNIYRRGHIQRLLHGLAFTDPTDLEHLGHLHAERLPFTVLHPAEPPCLVGVPANRVSSSSGMPHMDISPAALNEAYLRGERLAVPEHERLPAHAHLAYRYLSQVLS